MNLGGLLESSSFNREECYLEDSRGYGLATSSIDSLKGGILRGFLG